jgi:class 3 adenylate cyclase/pimeloyl-ACP methyl ester carboxylesterase
MATLRNQPPYPSGVQPEARYAWLGEDRIAYYATGDGPVDVVVTPGLFGSMDVEWDEPEFGLFFRTWASVCRFIWYDRRGSGSSDPVSIDALPPWESSVDEMLAVMDAAGSDRAVVFGGGDAGPTAMLAAATHPQRILGLLLYQTSARYVVDDDYPIGLPSAMADAFVDGMGASWGTEEAAGFAVPSRADDPAFRRWFARYMRAMTTPRVAAAFLRDMMDSDARSILPSVHVPTLVLHRRASPLVPLEQGRYLAEHIDGARFVELPGGDGPPFWEGADEFLDAVREFLAGIETPEGDVPRHDRAMATLLFTDIVGSTEQASELGDRGWRDVLDLHNAWSRRRVREHEGRLVKFTGDGILATFDGPGRAIACAQALGPDLQRIGVRIRTGLHAGEIELHGEDVGGVAVHIAARVMAEAGPGEILVSRTIRDLVVGSDVVMEDRGEHQLKGVDGVWQLFAVAARNDGSR